VCQGGKDELVGLVAVARIAFDKHVLSTGAVQRHGGYFFVLGVTALLNIVRSTAFAIAL
jgi:hypothetical protein